MLVVYNMYKTTQTLIQIIREVKTLKLIATLNWHGIDPKNNEKIERFQNVNLTIFFDIRKSDITF